MLISEYHPSEDSLVIVGEAAEPGELLKCEGCGEFVKETFESADMLMLCKPCFELPE